MAMTSLQFEELGNKVEAQHSLTGLLAVEVAEAVNRFMARQSGLPVAMAGQAVKPEDLGTTHQVLHLVDRVTPGWTIMLRGHAFEPDGHWTCSLRPSDVEDDAEMIGFAQGPELSKTLIVALLRVLAFLTRKAK
ncbi:hypothetical protein GC209_18160 [bacterium]|nr:hypothetical protein [bacterium]